MVVYWKGTSKHQKHQPNCSSKGQTNQSFDACHGGDVAPGSRTQGGGGGGGRETTDARRQRPDNTRKCATQHFRRRLALERGREGRGGRAGSVLSSRFLPSQARSSADRRPRRLSSQVGFRGVRTPAPRFPSGLAEARSEALLRYPATSHIL